MAQKRTVQHIHTARGRQRRKPGPQPKNAGGRTASTIRFPNAHRSHFSQIASDLDVPLGDYICFAMAKAHGLEIPEYLQHIQDRIDGLPVDRQEVLPLVQEA